MAGNGTCDDVELSCGFHINRSDGRGRNRYALTAPRVALAQARKVDVVLVTELTRWGRSMEKVAPPSSVFVTIGVVTPSVS